MCARPNCSSEALFCTSHSLHREIFIFIVGSHEASANLRHTGRVHCRAIWKHSEPYTVQICFLWWRANSGPAAADSRAGAIDGYLSSIAGIGVEA